jgi:hypothetical protein
MLFRSPFASRDVFDGKQDQRLAVPLLANLAGIEHHNFAANCREVVFDFEILYFFVRGNHLA